MSSEEMQQALRAIPAVDKVLADPAWDRVPHVGPTTRRDAARAVIDELRAAILAGDVDGAGTEIDRVVGAAVERAVADVRPVLRPVVNATGVVLHTNLGRAPLSEAALGAIARSAGRYTNLEMDLDSGRRDNRMDRLGAALARVLGCGDVVVANNCAAAVFLTLNALAPARTKVAISRGELVEIGGSFRMPDIMDASGAQMVGVGTTNRTHVADYLAAFDDGAKVAMKVHQSNFAMVGFTKEVSIEELCAAAHERDAIVLHDLGSGLLRSTPELGADCVRRSLDAGADAVLFSGDKLLGGPQCGLVAGRPEVIAALRRCPILRLVRPGKLTLLALEATLLEWERDPDGASIPVAAMTSLDIEVLRTRAEALAARAADVLGERAHVATADVIGTAGGGSSAQVELRSVAVAIAFWSAGGAEGLAAALRRADSPVVARIDEGKVLLDVRTLLDGDEDRVIAALAESCS